jgi:hypothetical protein
LPPSSKEKNPKTQKQSTSEVDKKLLWKRGFHPSSNFLKKHDIMEAGSVSVFR